MIGMIKRNEIDIAIGDFFGTLSRNEAADFSPVLFSVE